MPEPVPLQPASPPPRAAEGTEASPVRRAVLPAWARLLIYIPVAIVVFLIGNVIGCVPAVIYLFGRSGGEAIRFQSDHKSFETIIDASTLLESMPPWSVLFLQYASYVPVVVVTLLFARLLDRRSWMELGLATGPSMRRQLQLGALLGGTVALLVSIYVALQLVILHRTDDSVLRAVAYGVMMFAGVGFWEELIFRGYLLPNLAELVGRGWAIWVSSVLFWLMHTPQPDARDPATGVGLVLMGVLFALCYYGSGSLWLPMALHGTYDFLLVSLFQPHSQIKLPTVFSTEVLAPEWLVGPPGKAGLLDLAYLAVLLCGVYFWLYRREAPSQHPQLGEAGALVRVPNPPTSAGQNDTSH